ncbi:MAG: response regulator [Bacteroides sp.]|nr:response regulator [Bacteroides sp.]
MKNIFYRIYTYILFVLLSPDVHSQSICQIQEFSSDNGVAQRNVSNIIQDNKGFIWFATWNGLGKYDGYEFKKYRIIPDNENIIPSNRFYTCHIGQANRIWCRTENSRCYLFDSQKETFTDILQPLEHQNEKTYSAQRIYAFPNGSTWVVCQGLALHFNERLEAEEYSTSNNNLPGNTILYIQQDSEGNDWIFTSQGIRIVGNREIKNATLPYSFMVETEKSAYLTSYEGHFAEYDKATGEVHPIEVPYPHHITWMYRYNEDELYAGSHAHIFVYHLKKKTFKHLDFSPYTQNLENIYKDSHNELWFYTQEPGILRYNPQTGETQRLQTPFQGIPQSELSNSKLIFEDKQGTLWMVPKKGGFCYYNRQEKRLRTYHKESNNPQSTYSPIIYDSFYDGNNNLWFTDRHQMIKVSFYPDANRFHSLDDGYETRAFFKERDGNLWIANKRGFIRIYAPDKSLIGYLSAEGNITRTPTAFDRNVYCFMQEENGDIWLGTKKDGIFLLKKNGKDKYHIRQFIHQAGQPYSLSNNSIYSIFQDSRKRIWIGSYGGGLNLVDRSDSQEVRFLHHGNTPQIPCGKFDKIRTIKEINGCLFVGSKNGLLVGRSDFDNVEQATFYANIHRPDDKSSLKSNDVMSIFQSRSGEIYVLTFTGGINQIISKPPFNDQIRFKHFTESNGLPSDLVYSMIEDPEGDLWIVAENALSRFNPQNETFENYQKKHLQQDAYFCEMEPVLWNDKLLLGTNGGYMEIDPLLLQMSDHTPPLVLTELHIQGERQQTDLNGITELELNPGQRDISLHFVAPDYADPTNIKYTYRLKGLEDNWSRADHNRQARYINLPPGQYEFQVKSTNSDGVWADNLKTLPIHVVPTFWETHWAVLFYILLSILFTLVCVYIFYIIYRLRHRISIEKQLTHIKLRFFTDISHELRTPLTLITSPVAEVLEHEKLSPNARKHLEVVHNNTERMLQLVNQILDFRKIENRKMKLLLEHTEIIGTLRGLMDNFTLMAEEKQIDFTLQSEETALYTWIDRDKFQKIVLNLISNAFKYTPGGKAIRLSVQKDEAYFTVRIEDEGSGISAEKLPLLLQRFETLVKDNILQPSSGIGLSLVKELIELHLGSIHVESEPGQGSTFIVRLPLDKESYADINYKEFILDDGNASAPDIAPAGETTPAPIPEDALSILVVEDNTELREFLKDILSGSYRVWEAANGQEGLELARQQVPDFIISDIMMPVMDGLDMVKAIKEDRDICHIPIILLSAKSSLDDRINGLEQGVDDYITKPFSSTYLKTRIRSLLQQRKQLQQRYMEQYARPAAGKKDYTEPEPPQITLLDEQFMETVRQAAEKHIENADFTIDLFTQEVGIGRTVFYQKLKTITGLTPIDFLQTMRIKRAAQLMDSSEYNVSTIAYMTGFSDPKYFSKCFKKHTGLSPTEYISKKRK